MRHGFWSVDFMLASSIRQLILILSSLLQAIGHNKSIEFSNTVVQNGIFFCFVFKRNVF